MANDNDVQSGWLKNCLKENAIEDEAMIKAFIDEEHIVPSKETMYDTMPEDIVEQILTTPILLFQDMMTRMQQAIIAGHKKNMKPGGETARLKDLLKQKFNEEGYAFDEKDISMGLDISHFSAPILLDVRKTTELFRKGQLNEYIAQRTLLSNKYQRELILALEGPSADKFEDESVKHQKTFRMSDGLPQPSHSGKSSTPRSDGSTSPTTRKRPNVPQLHPLNPNIRKVPPSLSARARAFPNVPIIDNNPVTNMANNLQPHGMIPQNNRRVAVAVRRNPIHMNNIRTRIQPHIPQRVSIRQTLPLNNSESELKVVSIESLKNPAAQSIKMEPQLKPQPMIRIAPKPIVSLPPSITVVPAPSETEGFYANAPVTTTNLNNKPTDSNVHIPEYRPASARKSPHKSTMYSNSTTPVPIQPKAPVENTVGQHYVSIQPRQSVGQSQGSVSNATESNVNVEDLMDDGMPQIMSTEGGVSSFISKLNSLERNANKSDQTPAVDKADTIAGSWLLGCQQCGKAFTLTSDYSYRQHLMVEHSIEVDDKEIDNIKFFANTVYKCKKCDAAFLKHRSVHHQTCSPGVKIEDAFQELPVPIQPKIATEIIKCGLCEIKFDTRIDLRQHLGAKHAELANFTLIQPKYRCSQCLKAFSDSATLTSHVKSCKTCVATKETVLEIARSLLKCEVCMSTHKHVSEVQVCYAEKKLIRCMLCLYTCISRQNFSKHMLNFHRRNNVGIVCPFCPNSEIAAVRAQFEHIVSQHYTPAIESDDKRLSEAKLTAPPLLPTPTGTRLIRVPAGQTPEQYLQSAGTNSGTRTVYRKDSTGKLVLSSRTPFTSVMRPIAPAGLRPLIQAGARPLSASQLAGTIDPKLLHTGVVRTATVPSAIRPIQPAVGVRLNSIPAMRPMTMSSATGVRSVQISSAGVRTVLSAAAARPAQIVTTAGPRTVQLAGSNLRPVQLNIVGVGPGQGFRQVTVPAGVTPGIRNVSVTGVGGLSPTVRTVNLRPVGVPAGVRTFSLPAGLRQVSPAGLRTVGVRPMLISGAPGTPSANVRYVVTQVRQQIPPGTISTAETNLVSSAQRPLATPSTTTSAARMASPLIENTTTTITSTTPNEPIVAVTATTVTTDSTTSVPKTVAIATASESDNSQVDDDDITPADKKDESVENNDEILGF